MDPSDDLVEPEAIENKTKGWIGLDVDGRKAAELLSVNFDDVCVKDLEKDFHRGTACLVIACLKIIMRYEGMEDRQPGAA